MHGAYSDRNINEHKGKRRIEAVAPSIAVIVGWQLPPDDSRPFVCGLGVIVQPVQPTLRLGAVNNGHAYGRGWERQGDEGWDAMKE